MKHSVGILALIAIVAVSCGRLDDDDPEDRSLGEDLSHEMIVLGRQLDNPYSVKNMTRAIQSLYPTKADQSLGATDMYVRFLPETDAQMTELAATGLILMDHPLDYQIVKDGDWYHDPLVDDDKITWQYAVVPSSFKLPSGVRCEILEECYIPEGVMAKGPEGLDWEAIEREAFRITGNEDLLMPRTKGSPAAYPKGQITIIDQDANGGKPFGVAGVTVLCNTFVKFASAVTDRDGYYEMKTKFSSDVRYRLMFSNSKGFSIGLNLLLMPASTSALGKTSPEGIDCTISSSSDRKLFCRAAVNNAAYEYYERCSRDDLDIVPPSSDIRIWLFQNLSDSSTPMLRHGTLLDRGILGRFLGEYSSLLSLFLPDITVGLKNASSYSDIYAMTVHELSHASHFAQAGKTYWDKYIEYVITSFITEWGAAYGSASDEDSGYCGVGEIWAYFMQNLLWHDRYGGEMPVFGMNCWFHPQILRYLNERGLSVSQIFKAFRPEVTDTALLESRLVSLYPSQSSMINQVFTRYAE